MSDIPLFVPYVSELARRNVQEVLSGTQLAEGARVKAFEDAWSARYGVNGIALNSGTAALDLAFQLIGIGPGDEVIVPVLGHAANALPVIHRGGKVIFCDILDTLTADAFDALRKGAQCTRLKAIVYVHFGGSDASLRAVRDVAQRLGVPLVEDAAQCGPDDEFGLGEYTCFSFQAIKMLTAGDGGMLVCKDPAQLARARRLRWFGFDRTQPADKRDIEEAGFKYHMNDIAAAIAHGNLVTLDEEVLQPRENIARLYRNSRLPLLNYSWLTILVHPKMRAVERLLLDNNVGCGQQHYRLDKLSIFKGPGVVPNMDRLEERYLMIPFHHALKTRDAERIIDYVGTVLA